MITDRLTQPHAGLLRDAHATAGRPNDQSALSHEWLATRGPTQWPVLAQDRPARRRFTDGRFPTRSGKAKLLARPWIAPDEKPDSQFPLILTTGRVQSQWHTRTKTGSVHQLNELSPEPYVEISPHDAAELKLKEGQSASISSRRGRAVSKINIRLEASAGTIFMPIHWNELWQPEASPNEATSDAVDPISRQPSLKACAVNIAPLSSVTLAVIAGGAGTRMGMPKALLEMDGRPILKWLLDRLAWPGPTMLVTAPHIARPPGAELFTSQAIDPEDGQGPLRGILTALENLKTDMFVAIPVDMPNLDSEKLNWLADALAEHPAAHGLTCRSQGRIEPFPAIYRASAAPIIASRLAANQRSLCALCELAGFVVVDPPWPAKTWSNLNDREALASFQSRGESR